MKQENLIHAITEIDTDILDRYFTLKTQMTEKKVSPKQVRLKWISLAAGFCFVLLACLVVVSFLTKAMGTDQTDNFFLVGSIAINTENIILACFFAPVLTLACSGLMWMIGSGAILLPLWLLRDLCIPLLHFGILRRLIQKKKIQKTSTIVWSCLLLLVTVAADSVIMDFLLLNGRLALLHTVFRLLWAILCGVMILGQALALRFYQGNLKGKILLGLGAVLSLSINAFLTYLLGPLLARKFAIDGIEIILLPLSLIILSAYSYLLGRMMRKPYIPLKLIGWLVGILASECITLWLLGVPRTWPTEDTVTTVIWLASSAIAFAFCLLGLLKARQKGKQTPHQHQSSTDHIS